MKTQESTQQRWIALGGTLLFHAMIFLLFLLIVFKTPIPPFPETGGNGIEVNFGTSDDGMGDVQPEEEFASKNSNSENVTEEEIPMPISTPVRPANNRVLTQSVEEAPTVVKTETESTANSTANTTTAEVTKTEPRKVNQSALFPGRKGNSSDNNQGEGLNGKPGDQGSRDGSRSTMNHGPGGGTGSGPGDGGNGAGPGKGSGPKYSLAGRKASSLPVPQANFEEEGKVVVEIRVDKNGNVVFAKPGVKGSTTTSGVLKEIARKAALTAKFNASDDAPEEQIGTISYNFILR